MSKTVDEKVVEMRFDNQQFERNVQTSMSTIQKLKQSLHLEGASKGLENISAAAKKCDMSGISGAVDVVRDKFSALEIMGVTALVNITNSAVNAGKRIISALTIDPVKSGFEEYETQINAIQTILANTESKGSTLQDVNAALDELNHYADLTIYNFTEMTRNIGTFTAAGVDLDTSVSAIKGIANLAAVSGSTSQQASTAMYQLSQALAAGTVKLQDWNSVVNAGMGGQVFQDALKETARVHGVAIDQMIKDEGSFRETLSKGWLTTEVLTETLSKFTGDLSESQLQQMGYTEDQIKSIIKMGQTANDAATKVKTLTQLWDTLQEAAQSGWTKTWQLIIGDFEEAKEIYTSISDTVSDFLNKSADSRNNMLEGALRSNWGKLTDELNKAGIETQTFTDKLSETVSAHNIDVDKMVEKYGSLEKAFRSGAISTDILKETLNGLKNPMSDVSDIQRLLHYWDAGDDVKKIQQALQNLDLDIGATGVDGILGPATQAAIKSFQEANNLLVDGIIGPETIKALQETSTETEELSNDIFDLAEQVAELGGREKIIESFKNIFKVLGDTIAPITKAFREIFPPTTSEQLSNAIDGFQSFTEKLKIGNETSENLQKTFKGLFSVLSLFKRVIIALISPIGRFIGDGGLNGICSAFLRVTASVGDFLSSFEKSEGVSSFLSTLSDGIINALKNIGSIIDPSLKKINSLNDVFLYVQKGISKATSLISKNIQNAFQWIEKNTSIGEILSELDPGIENIKKKCISLFATLRSSLKDFDLKDIQTGIISFFKTIKNNDNFSVSGIGEKIVTVFDKMKPAMLSGANRVKSFGDAFLYLKETIQHSLESSSVIIKEKFSVFKNKILSLKQTILNAGKVILDTIKSIFDWLADNRTVSELAGIGLFVVIKKIQSVFESIHDFFHGKGKKQSSLAEDISGVLNGIKKSLSAFTKSVKIASLVSIAAAIAILTLAMKNIASLNTDQMTSSLMAIGILLGMITMSLAVLNNTGDSGKAGIGFFLVVMSLKKIAKALNEFGNMADDTVNWGLEVMAIALVEVGGILALVSKLSEQSDALKSGAGIFLVTASLLKVVNVITAIGKLKPEQAVQGLVGMGAALTELTAVIVALDRLTEMTGDDMIKSSLSIGILSLVLTKVANVIKTIGKLKPEQAVQGLVGMGAALTELTAVIVALDRLTEMTGDDMIKSSLSIGILSLALTKVANVMKTIGKMTWDEIAKGLVGMGGALAELGVTVGLLGTLAGPESLLGSASLLLGIQGLGDLADALKKFGSMNWTEIGHGLTAMGAALGETALGGLLNTFSGLGAVAVAEMAAPLGDLADSVKKWTGVTVPEGLGSQLGVLAEGVKKFNFTGWGADAIAALAAPLGDLGNSISKWSGISVPDDIGTGLENLAGGVKEFNFSGWGADAIGDLATPLGNLADSVKKWSGVTVSEDIGTALENMAVAVSQWNYIESSNISNVISPLSDFAEAMKPWNDVSISEELPTRLTTFADSIDKWNDISSDHLLDVCDAIIEIGNAATDISIIDFDSIAAHMTYFASSISSIDVSASSFTDIGSNIVDNLENAISDSSGSMNSMGSGMTDAIASGVSSGAESVSSAITSILNASLLNIKKQKTKFSSAGVTLMNGLASGIQKSSSSVASVGGGIARAGKNAIRAEYGSYYSAGVYVVSGFVNGLRDNIQSAAAAGAAMAKSTSDAVNANLDINSPSRVMYRSGGFAGMGFVNGLIDYKKKSYEAGTGIADSARNGLSKAISTIGTVVQNGIDTSPTIRPILDLSDIRSGAGQINGIIGTGQSIGISSNIGAISTMMNNRQSVTNNDDVVSAIGRLQKTISSRSGDSYVINGVAYDDGTNISNAVKTLVQAINLDRRS